MEDKVDVVLVPGLWLPAAAWNAVTDDLTKEGVVVHAVELPGQGSPDPAATFDDQLAAILAVTDALDRPLVVGHSAAAGLAWAVADRRPERIAAVVLIGGFPVADGEVYAAFLPPVDGLVSFPGWEPFEGPDAADLDGPLRAAVEAQMVPVPATVTQATVSLIDPRRYDVPTVMICPEFSPDDVQDWIRAGDLPELGRVANLQLLDLNSGHWPMYSRPAQLAELLAAVVDELSS